MNDQTQEMTRTNGSHVAERNGRSGDEMRRVYIPKVDIFETADDIIVAADMPGVGPDDIEITLEKSVLTINGFVRQDETGDHKLAYAEYSPGNFHRTFNLSDGVDIDNIEATIEHGVLRLVLPKAAEVKARKIAVKGA